MVTEDSIERWRRDTPGCEGRIHLNNAGAALMPDPVLKAIRDHLDLEAEIGGYEAEDAVADRVREVHGLLGRVIGAGPDQIAIVENATVVGRRLQQAGVNVNVPLMGEGPNNAPEAGAPPVLRISPHYYNTSEEIDRAVAILGNLLDGVLGSEA